MTLTSTTRVRVWREQNPEKARAHDLVRRAVRSGRLVRPNLCSRCGTQCRPQAHHHDYTRPLDVEWLCALCHKNDGHRQPDRMAVRDAPAVLDALRSGASTVQDVATALHGARPSEAVMQGTRRRLRYLVRMGLVERTRPSRHGRQGSRCDLYTVVPGSNHDVN